MKISKRQLRRIIRESCGLDTGHPPLQSLETEPFIDHHTSPDVPVPEDYNAVRDLLSQNQDIVDVGLSSVMQLAGTSCERSTAQGIIDHLQDMLQGDVEEEEISYTGNEIFDIGYEA